LRGSGTFVQEQMKRNEKKGNNMGGLEGKVALIREGFDVKTL
jgi:hypothetical protein